MCKMNTAKNCQDCKKITKQKKMAWKMYYQVKQLLIDTIIELKPTNEIKNRIKNLIKMKPDYFEDKCCICLESLKGNISMLKCGHYEMHSECIKDLENCPFCRKLKELYTEIEI